ncbi:MAG: ATP-dependent Clp protease ATP-binding subunit [Bacteroidaceae bacterium]|nr:ATP-dependent Clp protease ATP-binding subunit [Bacteroidaceae bacterium]
MAQKFSEETSKMLSYSRQEAQRLHCNRVEPEHLMLGFLRLNSDINLKIFTDNNIDINEMKGDMEKNIMGTDTATEDILNIDLSASANHLIRMAVVESTLAGSGSVEPIHVLMAMMSNRSKNTVKDYLEEKHLNYNTLRDFIKPISKNPESDLTSSQSQSNTQSNNNNTASNNNIQPKNNNSNKQNPFGPNPFTNSLDDDDQEEFESEIMGDNSASVKKGKKGENQSKTPILDNFSTDLTLAARQNKLDPMVGREREIERVEEILCRRKKNNPVLIGEPGVGKSAIVEGLAQMIADKKTSPVLFDKRLLSLDLTAVVAGTKYRGQFEERMKGIIQELEENPDIIIFLDEIHTLIGSGSAAGSMDGANILKPALARGTVQCIGATTLDEYRKSIEKDGAMERRFQKVIVEPTSKEETLEILHNLKDRYEKHHRVCYSDDALKACVDLTERYISDRYFPDKAIDAMDEVGSRIHLKNSAVPQPIIDKENEIKEIRKQKMEAVDSQDFEAAANLRDQQTVLEKELQKLKDDFDNTNRENYSPVNEENVADVVSMMSGVPVNRVKEAEGKRLKEMADVLKAKVIAQDDAITKMVKAIQRNRIGLRSKNHPIGAFMFLGPTGVGKTHLAKKLAEEMFGSADAIIRVDMSEYSESFNTSRLVGAPPGYVGYDEGGQLTERVRRKPYSIVLLDEIEKAHSNVFNMLLQVLDEGRMTDGNGRLIDFSNTIIIMTSNAGTRQLKDFGLGIGFERIHSRDLQDEKNKEYARSIIQKSLSKQFAPEFLNRLDEIIMFDQLSKDAIKKIIDLELRDLISRVEELGYHIEIEADAKDFVAEKGYDIQYGARPLKRAIQTYIEDNVCELLLSETLSEGDTILIRKEEEKIFAVKKEIQS